jgi:hypothetical protein
MRSECKRNENLVNKL